MDTNDWRAELLPHTRQMEVNEIMETLKSCIPVSGQEGLAELRKIAVRCEEKIYGSATSQSDYHQRVKNRIQNTRALALMPSNFGVNRNGPSHTGVRKACSSARRPGGIIRGRKKYCRKTVCKKK